MRKIPSAGGELRQAQASRTASMPDMIAEGWGRDEASTRHTHPPPHLVKDSGHRLGALQVFRLEG